METRLTTVRVCSLLAALIFFATCALLAGCAAPNAAASPSAHAENPLRTYEDYDDLTRALGFDMVQIAGGGYEPESFTTIDGRIGQIIYTKDDTELNLRMAKGTGDISGVGGVTYRTTDIYGHEVRIGNYEDIQVAVFQIGDYDYALSATGMTPQFFEGLVTQVVDQMSLS